MKEKNIQELWKRIRDPNTSTMVEHLGIKILEITEEKISGTMPVDHRTIQYYGMLHGGASVAFAETLASIAAAIHLDLEKEYAVGLEINANHIKGAPPPSTVYGVANPIHLGKRTQVWNIEMKNEKEELLCIARCTMAVITRP